ncbi:MAG: phosphotransferase [Chlamydiales bacterium]|nr:phosphotransferase [Chlamydiales bacterium]
MQHKQLKNLPKNDPLFNYLCAVVLPKILPSFQGNPEFAVYRLHSSTHNNKVYLYKEINTHKKFVGKFFTERGNSSKAASKAYHEFQNLTYLQNCHLNCHPHSVIKPIAYNPDLNCLLIIEYADGVSLCKIIRRALSSGKMDFLFETLSLLAYFMATLHNQTAIDTPVDFNRDCTYFHQLVNQLKSTKNLSHFEVGLLTNLCENWKRKEYMWQDRQVLVHGDATPPNFIFSKENNILAIDFERMKRADRIFDLGRIVGELQHYFMHHGKHRHDAEPFIGHFLWEYCKHFPNQTDAFHSITKRIPFQIAITLMRIARNTWIEHSYSHRLLHEVKQILNGASHAN